MALEPAAATAQDVESIEAALVEDCARLKGGDEHTLWRGHLRQLLSFVLGGLARGDLAAARRGLRALEKTRGFVDEFLPRDLPPPEEAARELAFAWSFLELAEEAADAIEPAGTLRPLKAWTSGKAILEFLYENQGRFFRRGEIEKALAQRGTKLTAQRVGQILEQLYRQRYLRRTERRARGATAVGHYALSSEGMALCREQLSLETVDPKSLVGEAGAEREARGEETSHVGLLRHLISSELKKSKLVRRVLKKTREKLQLGG